MNALEEFREKTLVEHLREVRDSDNRDDCIRVYAALHDGENCGDVECSKCKWVQDLADRIEAEYTPYPLDADGVPCRLGDHVKSGETCGDIKEMLLFGRGHERWEIYLTTLDDSVPADGLHHVEPPKQLTKEDIDTLAESSSVYGYWGCSTSNCAQCPSLINGKKPHEHYNVADCHQAQILDILRLERERVEGEQS